MDISDISTIAFHSSIISTNITLICKKNPPHWECVSTLHTAEEFQAFAYSTETERHLRVITQQNVQPLMTILCKSLGI